MSLALGKGPYIDWPLRFDAHSLQGRFVRDWRDYEISRILKSDESTVKQPVDAWRQEQAVFAVEALFI